MPFTIDVKITNPDGQEFTFSQAFSFVPPPIGTSLQPNAGPQAGGTVVVITGSGFQAGAVVKFGNATATNVQVSPDGQRLTYTAPAYLP